MNEVPPLTLSYARRLSEVGENGQGIFWCLLESTTGCD
jgi:hypothetical protein